jgi:hypothetical protein
VLKGKIGTLGKRGGFDRCGGVESVTTLDFTVEHSHFEAVIVLSD